MSKLDLGSILANNGPFAEGQRDIEIITKEILALKQSAGDAILSIGQRLIEAKAVLPHGSWLPWLAEKVEFSERTAQTFMRLAREWSNPQALADLGASKALTLLALPADEREQFIQEQNVVDMTSRELERAIRERKEAQDAAAASAARADAAEAAQKALEADRDRIAALLEQEKQNAEASQAAVADLEAKITELKAAPVDVAIMEVDQATLDKAKADAIAEMQGELDKAKAGKKKAEERRQAVEEQLALTKAKLESLQKEDKKAAIAADKDMATFEAYFLQLQDLANRMRGLLLKVRSREDKAAAVAMQKALCAAGEAIRRAAE
ncbi:MAG: DUF3102 domain-containing protein [Oscillospiraceae bacterium]|nr:DUF3102 domain-containing protein [Oscillospiraceae bacterium]